MYRFAGNPTAEIALIPPLLTLIDAAGAAILEEYASGSAVELKADRSPLTQADRRAHQILEAGLRALSPAWPVLSEESPPAAIAARRSWTRFWLVDPLDGTREFLARNGEFTVNIALIDQHAPVLGVIAVPAAGIIYWGVPGHGAFKLQRGGSTEPISARPNAEMPLRVCGSRSHRGDSLRGFLQHVGPHELIPVGSALKFGWIAEGRADVYPRLGPTSEWDTAAGQAVAEAAGAAVITADGEPLRYNLRDTLLNPHFIVYADRSRDWSAALRATASDQ